MSVQFGKCNFDGEPLDPKDLNQVRSVLAPYGPDGEGYICRNNFWILYRAFHTTKESRREQQPCTLVSGAVITWDGRLDNRDELIDLLGGPLSHESTDVDIVAAAHEHWGTSVFSRLIGDWALSIWNPKDRSLILAKDFVGTRHLFYSVEKTQATWCTVLDPLVLFANRSLGLEEEYIAGCLSLFPATHLTPYVGIHSVPPSSFVRLLKGGQVVSRYWDFEPNKRIRYRTDGEYEGHFRAAFAESVRRRVRSDAPVLAELSGGMDSSSIVCMADIVISQSAVSAPRLNTVSYYDDSEPNWNERPYFSRVEERRGRVGCHINVEAAAIFNANCDTDRFAATPASSEFASEAAKEFIACLHTGDNRVVLSGIGGDEVTGGVPTPIPELADLLASGQVTALARQLKLWALNKRKPWFHLLIDTVREFCSSRVAGVPAYTQPAPWLNSGFVGRNRSVLMGYPKRLTFFGALPSFQENIASLNALRRQLGCFAPSTNPLYEKRYPFLDRDFLEFIFAVPPQQLIRPGQRRSLMRRALTGIVPDELLNRKRKAFVARAPRAAISAEYSRLAAASCNMVTDAFGIVCASTFYEALQEACKGLDMPVVPLMRTLYMEFWLRSLLRRGVCTSPQPIGTVSLASAART